MLKAAEIAGGIGFPHAVQVLRLTRTVTDRKTGKRHTETVYAVTSLSITDATPTQIAQLVARALGDREQAALGARRHLCRRPLPDPQRQRATSHGYPAQHCHRPAPTRRPRQHRKSTAPQRPKPSPARQTTPDQVKCDFAETLGWESTPGRVLKLDIWMRRIAVDIA